MLKSTFLCFSLLSLFGEPLPNNTCIPIVKPEYVTLDSEKEIKGLKAVQETYFKPQKTISTNEGKYDMAPTPTKPILIIKATHE